MKKIRGKYIQGVLALALFSSTILQLFTGMAFAAGANTVYISPSTTSVTTGSTVTVSLRVNAATAAAGGYDGIDGIDATLNFSGSLLQTPSVDPTGSAFSTGLLQTVGSSSVRIARALGPGESFVTGDVLVVKVSFKAAASGSASISLTNTNTTHGAPYTNPSVLGATLTITDPVSTGGGTGGTGSTGGSTGSTGSTGGSSGTSGGTKPPANTGSSSTTTTTTNNSTAAPAPTNLTVSNQDVQFTQAAFTANTTAPTQVYIRFGTSKDALTQQTQPDAFGTTHQLTIDPKLLSPGTTYYYAIVTKDQSGQVSQSDVQSFTTKGLTLTVVVYDKNHKPLAHHQVTLHSTPQTGTTDANGSVTFQNVAPGDHKVIYQAGNQSYTQPLTVANNVQTAGATQTAAPQNVAVVYNFTQSSSKTGLLSVTALVLIVAAVGAWFFLVQSRKKPAYAAVAANVTSMPSTASVPNTGSPLDTIPQPEEPQPGSTVAPNDTDDTTPNPQGPITGAV